LYRYWTVHKPIDQPTAYRKTDAMAALEAGLFPGSGSFDTYTAMYICAMSWRVIPVKKHRRRPMRSMRTQAKATVKKSFTNPYAPADIRVCDDVVSPANSKMSGI